MKKKVKSTSKSKLALRKKKSYEAVVNKAERDIKNKILQEKKQQKEYSRSLKEWLKQNESKFSEPELVELWQKTRDSMVDELLKLAITNLSMTDAAQRVNEILDLGLKLTNAGINTVEFSTLAIKIFRIEVMKILLNKTTFKGKTKLNVFNRYIAKEFPVQDEKQNVSVLEVLKEMRRLKSEGPEYIPIEK